MAVRKKKTAESKTPQIKRRNPARKKLSPRATAKAAPTPDTEADPTETGEGDDWESPQSRERRALLNSLGTDPIIAGFTEQAAQELEVVKAAAKLEVETLKQLNDDTRAWNSIAGGGNGAGILSRSDGNRVRVLEQCYYLFYKNPLARNIIRSYTYLTLGTGMKISFPTDTNSKVIERWEKIEQNSNWRQRVHDIITMTYLLGEQFVLRHPIVNNKAWDEKVGRVDRPKLQKILSKMDADKVMLTNISPKEITSIIPSTKNREIPRFYQVADQNQKTLPSYKGKRGLFAEDVSHFRIDDMGCTQRGRPILEPVLKYLSYYTMYQLDRMTMTSIRVRIPIIRKVKAMAKAGVKAAMETRGLPRPGTIAIVGNDEIWEYPGGPQDGSSAEYDARAIRLMIAAGVSLPEFLVTMDASNSNMASLLSASAPLVPMIASYRALFACMFADLIEEIVGVRPVATFPAIIRDNIEQLVKASSLMYHDKVLSKKTYQVKTGLDPDIEKEQLEEEALEDEDARDALQPDEDEEQVSMEPDDEEELEEDEDEEV